MDIFMDYDEEYICVWLVPVKLGKAKVDLTPHWCIIHKDSLKLHKEICELWKSGNGPDRAIYEILCSSEKNTIFEEYCRYNRETNTLEIIDKKTIETFKKL